MKGRIEHKMQSKLREDLKLESVPDFVKDFYNSLYLSKEYTTAQSYINIVLRFYSSFPDIRVEDFNYDNVNQYFLNLKGRDGFECSDSYYATNRAALLAFGDHLRKKKLIEENPVGMTSVRKVKDETNKDYLTTDELSSVLESIKYNTIGTAREKARRESWIERNLAIIALMAATGIRVTAVTELNLADYDGAELAVLDKGRKTFKYELDDKTCEILNAWIEKRRQLLGEKESEALFISNHLTRITAKSIRDLVKAYTQHLGKNISPHRIRASYAIKLYKETSDIYYVKQCLKHSHITTTVRYMSDFGFSNKEAAKIATKGLYRSTL